MPTTTWEGLSALPSSAGSLVRTTDGLLARLEYDNVAFPFAVADWDTPAAGSISVSVVDGALRATLSVTGSARVLRNTDVAVQSAMYTQAVLRALTTTGTDNMHLAVCALVLGDAENTNGAKGLFTVDRPSFGNERAGLSATGFGTTVTDVALRARDTDYRAAVFNGADGALRSYDFHDAIAHTGSRSASTGQPGLEMLFGTGTTFSAECRRFFACSHHSLRVTGLPEGATVELRSAGDSLVSSVTVSAGAALFDLMEIALPYSAAKVRILDSSAVVLAEFSPSDGVWPGDVYTFTPASWEGWGARSASTASWGARSAPSHTTWTAL